MQLSNDTCRKLSSLLRFSSCTSVSDSFTNSILDYSSSSRSHNSGGEIFHIYVNIDIKFIVNFQVNKGI